MFTIPVRNPICPRLPEDNQVIAGAPLPAAIKGCCLLFHDWSETWALTGAHQIVRVFALPSDFLWMIWGRPPKDDSKHITACVPPRTEAFAAMKAMYASPGDIDALARRLDAPVVIPGRVTTAPPLWLG